ncbi:MAG TPA: SH3 domain-containing protein [Spirochaetota bacterium]|nr:SH3 domain-containing protein [Spirochaetota bacterium]HPS85151.1 SH3 domain-containing protein [Spirochaetota bacterium]
MKKFIYTLSVLLLSLILIQGCKKGDKQGLDLAPGDIVKYAKFSTAVYKDQELKTWGATLSKTEPVKLLETVNIQIKGVSTEIAKVKLSDNTVLYLQLKNLADKPVVFIEDTKAYIRNNASSKVFAIIPKGTIGFVLQENAEWIQVYVGQLDGKWITQQWVNSGFTAEEIRVQEAKLFEESAAILKNAASKPDQKKQAEANLKDLTSSTGIFADMARNLIGPAEGMGNAGSEINGAGGNSGAGEAVVQAAAGLTMREEPGTSGKSIVVIPDGNTVKIIDKGTTEETIAGKTSVWYHVEWNGKRGWVFGGFLAL